MQDQITRHPAQIMLKKCKQITTSYKTLYKNKEEDEWKIKNQQSCSSSMLALKTITWEQNRTKLNWHSSQFL